MAYQNIRFELAGRVATLTFDQPATRNAISDQDTIDEIVDVLASIPGRPEISVLVVTGAGEAFSSGGNVKKMREKDGIFSGTGMDIQQAYRLGIQRIPVALYELEVPVIAAVNGAAVGAGFDVAMMCDMRIASTRARFGETFLNLGIIPGDGGAWFLPRAIGHQQAAYMTFTGRLLDAEQALAAGIVLEVTQPDALLARAYALAEEIAAKPPQALRAAKRLLRAGQQMELKPFLDYCAAVQAACHGTADHAEALAAFFDKRTGRYQGR